MFGVIGSHEDPVLATYRAHERVFKVRFHLADSFAKYCPHKGLDVVFTCPAQMRFRLVNGGFYARLPIHTKWSKRTSTFSIASVFTRSSWERCYLSFHFCIHVRGSVFISVFGRFSMDRWTHKKSMRFSVKHTSCGAFSNATVFVSRNVVSRRVYEIHAVMFYFHQTIWTKWHHNPSLLEILYKTSPSNVSYLLF